MPATPKIMSDVMTRAPGVVGRRGPVADAVGRRIPLGRRRIPLGTG
ncbi:hypothetical protein ACFVT5_08910 [Streptomyces sp. NPDC058001]